MATPAATSCRRTLRLVRGHLDLAMAASAASLAAAQGNVRGALKGLVDEPVQHSGAALAGGGGRRAAEYAL